MPDLDETIAALRAWTRDQDGHVRAAVELLVSQGKWLDDEDFTTMAVRWGGKSYAWIDWGKAAQVAGDSGASGGELSVLRFAIALGSNQFRLSTLDDRNARLYMEALAASGEPPAVAAPKPGQCVHRQVAAIIPATEEDPVGWLCKSCGTRLPADWAVREEDL